MTALYNASIDKIDFLHLSIYLQILPGDAMKWYLILIFKVGGAKINVGGAKLNVGGAATPPTV